MEEGGETKREERETDPPFSFLRVTDSHSCLCLPNAKASERVQTNGERLGRCVALWDDLKAAEHDVGRWAAASVADLTDTVANLSDGQKSEARLAAFQVGRGCD